LGHEASAPPSVDRGEIVVGMLADRLKKRYQHLKKWAKRSGVTCFRLYERDINEYPLIIDWYDGDVVVWFYDRYVDTSEADRTLYIEEVLAELYASLGVTTDNIYQKYRFRQKGERKYQRLERSNVLKTIEEQGLKFEVNLSDFLDTGLFLDHRPLRAKVRQLSAGKRVLNLFSYSGSFSVYARAGGAQRTITVDLSQSYLDWAQRNFSLNGFAPKNSLTSDTDQFVKGDVLRYLERAVAHSVRVDMIICDPPTFSNSKRMDDASFVVDRDYPSLIAQCEHLLSPGGILFFSNNSRQFQLDESLLPSNMTVTDISAKTIPEDFRNQKIHRCWQMEKSL
jgi:23S rRNA (cytosine1962-C5)-methyltransferase